MGLLDFLQTDEGRLGMAMLAAGGPRTDPNQSGFGTRMQDALGYVQKQKDDELKRQQAMQAQQMQQMQLQEMQQKVAQERQMRELAGRFQIPAQQGLAPLQGDPQSGILPSAGRPAQGAGFDYKGYAGALANVDPMKALALQQALQKEQQINKLDAKDFTPESVQKFHQSGNYGDLVRLAEAHFANTGGQTVAMNRFTGLPLSSIANTQSPDNVATTGVTMRGQNLTNSLGRDRLSWDQGQAGKPQFKDGYWVTPPSVANPMGSVLETPISAAPKGSEKANQTSAVKSLALIDQADKLLGGATNSYFGAGADMLAQTVGVSTKGAQASAQLKAIEGALMMSQPRMEGPQSDKDTALYRQMAAQIGDSTVPAETRKAALDAVRSLHQKYAPSGGSTGSWDAPKAGKTPIASGMLNGRKVIKYSDGSTAYAD